MRTASAGAWWQAQVLIYAGGCGPLQAVRGVVLFENGEFRNKDIMGYNHYVIKATCGHCEEVYVWSKPNEEVYVWSKPNKDRIPTRWRCICGSTNWHVLPDEWPKVPPYLFIGHERLTRFKVYATSPEHDSVVDAWAPPWSIRSFVLQSSGKFKGCDYWSVQRGTVLGQPVFRDTCRPYEIDVINPEDARDDCHLVSGWSTGVDTCPLWKHIEGNISKNFAKPRWS